jgi:AcrR family transcriptional regulator
MSTAKIPTRQRLIDAALRRFYRDGFRSVGIDQILADVGISKTAFYKHFESKEDLMLAALETQNAWLQGTFRSMIQAGGSTAVEQLHAAFDVVETILASDEFQGCIFVNVAMEFPLQHEPAHVLAAQNKRAVENLLCELAVEANAKDPRGLAQELCLIMEGAYVTRHVTGDKNTFHIVRRIAKQMIAANCPGDKVAKNGKASKRRGGTKKKRSPQKS